MRRTGTRASKHSACSGEPGLNKIDDWRFKARRKCLAGRSGSGQRENSRANDCADADAGQSEAVRACVSSVGLAPLLRRSDGPDFWF